MLEGLEAINWEELHHAYGPATHIPELLRRMTTADEEECDELRSTLSNLIHHQGDLYDSTVATIPFLIELLTIETVKHKERIAYTLFSLHDDQNPYSGPMLAEQVDQALKKGYDLYIDLMMSGSPPLQAALSTLLTCFSDYRSNTLEAIHRVLPLVIEAKSRTFILESLLKFEGRYLSEENDHALIKTLFGIMHAKNEHDATRLAAARVIMTCTTLEWPDMAKRLLIEALVFPARFRFFIDDQHDEDTQKGYPRIQARQAFVLGFLIYETIERVEPKRPFGSKLLDLVRITSLGREATRLGQELTTLVFSPAAVMPSKLSFHQQLAIAGLLNNIALWWENDGQLEFLKEYGLPSTQEELKLLLGL